jgi:hypothetical protein
MPITTFNAAELSRLGGFSYSNKASQAVATKLNALAAEVVNNAPLAPTADTVSSAVGVVNQAFASKVTIPANMMAAGARLAIRAGGVCTASAGVVNLTLTLKVGGTTIAACSAFDPGPGSAFFCESSVVVQSAGAGGKFNSSTLWVTKTGAGTSVVEPLSGYQAAVDTTAANDVTVLVTWAAGAGETVRLNLLSVDLTY